MVGSSAAFTTTPTIAAGAYHSLALKSDGTVWAWGENGVGQLGDGTTTDRYSPVQVQSLNNIIAITVGPSSSFAVESDGTVWGWGYHGFGLLGSGVTTNRTTPAQISGITDVCSIAAGSRHVLALKSDGTVMTWGDNQFGQLGNRNFINIDMPVQAYNQNNVVAIAGGAFHSLIVKSDGTVWGWGRGGVRMNYGSDSPTPAQVQNLNNVTAVAGGVWQSSVLKSDGTVWTWGLPNYFGDLDYDKTADTKIPMQVQNLNNIIAIAEGDYHSLSVKSDGTVWAWRNNSYGELGNGTNASSSVPVQVKNLSNIVSVAGGSSHSLALKSDGTVWAWGRNSSGRLGDNTETNRLTPVQVVGSGGVGYLNLGENGNGTTDPGQTYTVTYNANGGTGAPAAQTKTHGVPLMLSGTVPTREGYTFIYWLINEADMDVYDRGAYFPGDTLAVDKNVRLTAFWTKGESTPYTTQAETIGLSLYNQTIPLKWGTDLFKTSPASYTNDSHSLATVAAALSYAAYDENDITACLEKLRFNEIKTYNYDNDNYGAHNVGFALASRLMTIDGTDTNVVAIIVRGTDGEFPFSSDWLSNFYLGHNGTSNMKEHLGFGAATSLLEDDLLEYLDKNGLTGKSNKYLVTGHSRGGAVANIVARDLYNGELKIASKNNIYAYTFAAPNTVVAKEYSTGYDYIYNFVNPEDIVPRVPLEADGWGYGKHGKVIPLPVQASNSNYADYGEDFNTEFQKLTGLSKTNTLGWETADALAKSLKMAFPDASSFADFVIKSSNLCAFLLGEARYYYQMVGNGTPKLTINTFIDWLASQAADIGYIVGGTATLAQDAADCCGTIGNVFNSLAGVINTTSSSNANLAREIGAAFETLGQNLAEWVIGSTVGGIRFTHFEYTMGHINRIGQMLGDLFSYGHRQETYLAWMLALEKHNAPQYVASPPKAYTKLIKAACPVDVYVYDKDGNLIGSIVDNVIQKQSTAAFDKLYVFEDCKLIYLPEGVDFTIKLVGTDTGVMEYSAEKIDAFSGDTVEVMNYTNVSLVTGKQMVSQIDGNITVLGVKLLVTDASGTPVKEVQSDGTERPYTAVAPKWWQKLPDWLKWVLKYIFFGWLWM
jgi:alpha-tubulin suppressor-like RCC1 family protein